MYCAETEMLIPDYAYFYCAYAIELRNSQADRVTPDPRALVSLKIRAPRSSSCAAPATTKSGARCSSARMGWQSLACGAVAHAFMRASLSEPEAETASVMYASKAAEASLAPRTRPKNPPMLWSVQRDTKHCVQSSQKRLSFLRATATVDIL